MFRLALKSSLVMQPDYLKFICGACQTVMNTGDVALTRVIRTVTGLSPPIYPARTWLVDSGATNHYTAKKDILEVFTGLSPPIPILTGRGYTFAYGKGNARVQLPMGEAIIEGVMWVPDLVGHASLLSVPQLTRSGCRVVFEKDTCEIYNAENLIARAGYRGHAYCLDEQPCSTRSLMLTLASSIYPPGMQYNLTGYNWATDPDADTPNLNMLHGTCDTQNLVTWHKRLGHLNVDSIRKLVNRASGTLIGNPNQDHNNNNCVSCLQSSQHRKISWIQQV